MSDGEQHVKANVHPDAPIHKGEHSTIPHPPPQDQERNRMKPVPDTGWKAPLPSKDGGDKEPDFLNKPPYSWKSEGNKFVPKYTACVPYL
jgi:hypothetical protein